MPHSLHAFKQARREHLHALGAAERTRREAAEFEVWRLLKEHAGDDVMAHVTVKCTRLEPVEAIVTAAEHIPIKATIADGALRFTLARRHHRRTFEHFADALAFGEPYGTANPPPPLEEVDPATLDTRKPQVPHG